MKNSNTWGSGSTGGTRKIADVPIPCSNPAHLPPQHMVFPPGIYEHVCPSCGQVYRFEIPQPSF
jgi:hypothetical protein